MWRDLCQDITDGEAHNIGRPNYKDGCPAHSLVGVYQKEKHQTLDKAVSPLNDVN